MSQFYGWLSAICVADLVVSTLFAMIDPLSPALIITFVILLDCVTIALVIGILIHLGVYVFKAGNTQDITLWVVVDAFLAHTLSFVILGLALWKVGASYGDYTMFSHTGAVGVWYALYDMGVLMFWVVQGVGVTDNLPVHEAARALLAVFLLWSSVVHYAFLAAAIATVLKPEQPRVNAYQKNWKQ